MNNDKMERAYGIMSEAMINMDNIINPKQGSTRKSSNSIMDNNKYASVYEYNDREKSIRATFVVEYR